MTFKQSQTWRSPARILVTASKDLVLSMSTRPSQQPTRTAASFLAHQVQPQPHDISFDCPDDGSHNPDSGDIVMCPPLGGLVGDGLTGTGVPAGPGGTREQLVRDLSTPVIRQSEQIAFFSNSMAAIQRHAALPMPPAGPLNGCAHTMSAQMSPTNHWRHCVSAWTPCNQLLSL